MIVETIIRRLGGLLAFTTLGIILYGIWRGTRRLPGRTSGRAAGWLRSWWFYLASSAIFFGLAWLGWTPLPWTIPASARVWMLALGSLLYFPGLSLLVWARLTLGKNYFVSSGFGAQLFADHQLVTSGPFAIIRHPMYIGLILAAIGSLLIYFTWTVLCFVFLAPLVLIRAWREEQALAAEFGEDWREYCKRVPALFPRLRKEKRT